ncbi:PD-(D/E)XK nuclease family protein [Bradyrhizobium sp. 192]|uniref:PD-(D/E)XK nuclease family protein n=1 Tax=Bradyrhizobium sp. 192 TaxID=2782660 RepID=UPI0020002F43|nr:PD-(D/E)XK nuclease family protein [Bradyrhizobium sp. 192]UPJ62061.1 PD-(D/E)XK nuclease family protein [Bradyrhizobium sp. 192]
MVSRSTIVVDGPLALRSERAAAAGTGAIGREIITLPLIAARLAGGFTAPAGTDILYPAIQAALAAGGFEDMGEVASLPGMPRAVLHSLDATWRADIDLASLPQDIRRFADLHLIEMRIQERLPASRMLPRDLRSAAMKRVSLSRTLLGPVTLLGIVYIDAIWRPLLNEIARFTDLSWDLPAQTEHAWFQGTVRRRMSAGPAKVSAESSADPKSEVVEALRWVRQLLSSGEVKAADIAIAATSTQDWDDHFLAYAASAGLPLHFSHGIPALSTPEGQACAALADIVTGGLSQERVWRLIRRLPARPFANAVPEDWYVAIPRNAGLKTPDQWRQAFAAARPRRATDDRAEHILLPMLELLARGADASREAGQLLLSGPSLAMWDEALRSAPPHAISLSLQGLRVADGRDPANSVVWGPASHLAASPRPFARLLGLTSRSWPRSENDDPLFPDHLLKRRTLHPVTTAERDRLNFDVIRAGTRQILVLSRPERSAKGSILSPSSLWPADAIAHKRDRIPVHAFSEADRLFARAQDAGQLKHVRQSQRCWQNWQRSPTLTAHDGLIAATHPAIEAALARTQSTTSLQRLLRDPLGFVWRYALGWRSIRLEPEPLQLDAFAFGELVHELISGAITRLEPVPGFARASADEIEAAIEAASAMILSSWPLQRSVPPAILWRHTVNEAARRTSKGLRADDPTRADTQSWSEVPFGQSERAPGDLPWDTTITIPIEQAGLVYGGRIDRLDIRATGNGAQITDYKSVKPPPKNQRIALGQGRELQRVLYAMAVRTLLPEIRTIIARLIYLADEPTTFELRGDELDGAITEATTYLVAAVGILRSGRLAPRWEQDGLYDDMRLALPADRESYLRRKASDFRGANQPLNRLWSGST